MRQSLRRLGKTAVVVPGIAVALTLGGCKEGQNASQPSDQASPSNPPVQTGPPGSQSPPPGTSEPTSGPTKLTITVRSSEKAKPVTRTLTCDPAGGSVPRAEAACAALAKVAIAKPDPFAPTPKGQMCTQIFGGPQVATVKGTWKGRDVDATFSRKNGCEVKRWNDLTVLMGATPVGDNH